MRDLSLALPATFSKKRSKPSISTYGLNLAILAAIVLIGLTYLFIVNSLGTKGYAIKNLEKELAQLEVDQKALQMQASDLQSINRIQTEVQKLNFVPATNVTYLKDSDFALK